MVYLWICWGSSPVSVFVLADIYYCVVVCASTVFVPLVGRSSSSESGVLTEVLTPAVSAGALRASS